MSFRNILTFVMLIFFVAFAFPAFACPINTSDTDISFQQMPPPVLDLVNIDVDITVNKYMASGSTRHSTNHIETQNIDNIGSLVAIMTCSSEVLQLACSRSE